MASKSILSASTRLNLFGILVLALLVFAARPLFTPLTWGSAIPLAFVGYAFFRVAYELTFNRKNVPTLATTYIGRGKISEILKREAAKQAGKTYHVIDLGSGRGELARRIASEIPEAKVTGIEIARIPYWQSKLIQKLLGPRNLSFHRFDFWKHDCSDIGAVVFYLSGTLSQKVGEKLFKELKPGSIVIPHTFRLSDVWGEPDETVEYRSPFKEVFYVYRKK